MPQVASRLSTPSASGQRFAERLMAYSEVALALAEVAQASSVRREISEALSIENASRSDLYDLFVKELPPFASIYLSDDGNIGGDTRSVIAGFYHVLGIPTPSDPDHLSSLLALLSSVLAKEAQLSSQKDSGRDMRLASVERAKSVIVGAHLLSWLPAYLLRAKELASPELSGWASCALDLASALSGFDASPHTGEDDGSVAAGANWELGESVSEIVKFITTPSKSGLIIAPSDIFGVADSLGAALRVGRKRFVLEELMNQAGRDEVLPRLAEIAGYQEKLFFSQAGQYRSLQGWSVKAKRTRELLS